MRSTRHLPFAAAAIVLVSALVLAGCGSDDDPTPAPAPAPTVTTSTERTTPTSTTPTPAPTAPTAANAGAAVATGRKLDALSRAYAPVSARWNYLVTAEVLWRDAVDNESPARTQRDRAGAVRLEILRMQPLLVRSQRGLKAQAQSTPELKSIQALLTSAITNRTLAMRRLDAVLDAASDSSVDDDAVDALEDAYRDSHDAAARAAREATNGVQELRASLGLTPAAEEAIR